MIKKVIIILLALFIFINAVGAIDSSNWTTANVGYETFKIPPQYQNPYKSDFNMYEFDEDIDVFTIRYVNPNIMSLYGYFIEKYPEKKVNVSGHDAIHFTYHDRHDDTNNSILWFSNVPRRYSGPLVSSMIGSGMPSFVRTFFSVWIFCRCSSCVPCEKFSRAVSMPA